MLPRWLESTGSKQLVSTSAHASGCVSFQMVIPSYTYVYLHCLWSFTLSHSFWLSNLWLHMRKHAKVMKKSLTTKDNQTLFGSFKITSMVEWKEQRTFRSRRFTWCHVQTPFSGETACRESSHYSALTGETTDSDAWWSNWGLQNEVATKWGRLVMNAVKLIQFRGLQTTELHRHNFIPMNQTS